MKCEIVEILFYVGKNISEVDIRPFPSVGLERLDTNNISCFEIFLYDERDD